MSEASGQRLARRFAAEVSDWRTRGLGRTLRPDERFAPGSLDFTSNDYLGLARHPEVCAAAARAASDHGAGGRAARLLGGGSPRTLELEAQLAAWIGTESSLLVPSGYQANLTLLPAIAGPGDVVVSDELNHASLIDGLRLSRARVLVYRHGDAEHARRLLEGARGARRRFCVTESIFSMDGDAAPLAALADVCADSDAGLIVDEAHAVGVIGAAGRGGFAASGADPASLVAQIITGGKALGAAGAFIAGSAALTDLLIHRGRGFVFSTAVPPAVVGALAVALDLVPDADELRATVRGHAQRIAGAVGAPDVAAAIVPVAMGDAERAVEAAAGLMEAGMDVRAVRPPTVPAGQSRLRVVCHADHAESEVSALLDALAPLCDAARRGSTNSAGTPGPAIEVAAPLARPLFIVGTDTDIGKTVVSAAAARALDAHYWKPVQTGDDSDTDTVSRLAGPRRDGTARAIAAPRYHFPLPASPHTAAIEAGETIDPVAVCDALTEQRAATGDVRLVVELAGGLHVPLVEGFSQADWLAAERPDVLLVARSGLGTLNHTLLTLEALRNRQVTPRALVLVGPPHPANAKTLRPHVQALFELPHLESLDPAALDSWLAGNALADALTR